MKTVLQLLRERHLDVNLHRPAVDEEERVATFFLYNLSGQIVGYQQYRPDADKVKNNHPTAGRYFTYRNKDTLGVWGVESLYLTPHVLFVTEGIFDAARFTNKGCSALASLTNNPSKDLRSWLQMLNKRAIAVCDADTSGNKLAKFGTTFEVVQGSKDLGDASDEYVDYLINKYV